MIIGARQWAVDDVPDPPYLHGTSTPYAIGDDLHVTVVREGSDPDPDYDDLRLMCFATTSVDLALDWACRRSLGDPGRDTLYVFRVELDEPEVDTNIHGTRCWPGRRDEEITSVMAPRGRVVGIELTSSTADCDNSLGRGVCAACRGR